jgi:hypothetical protein
MTALNTFKFGDCFLRPADERDRELAERWTAADPDHAGRFDPGFWLENKLGRDGFLLSDRQGPVYFFKMHIHWIFEFGPDTLRNVVQVFIQFPPCEEARPMRVFRALAEGCQWLERTIIPMGAEEMIFDSRNETLIRFCVKRLGFERDGEMLRKTLIRESGG